MVSQIDPSKPADGVSANKADLRSNLGYAKSEIEALQDSVANFPTSGFTGRRNRLINGNFYNNARGFTAAAIPNTTAPLFGPDRWHGQAVVGGAVITMTRQFATEPMAGTPHNGYMRLQTTTAKSPATQDYHVFGQMLEAVVCYDLKWGAGAAARPIVVSFWARASITGNYAIRISAATAAVYITSFAITQSNTWEYKTVSIPVPTVGTWDSNATTGYMKLQFDLGTGSARHGTQNVWLSDDTIVSFAGAVILCANTGAWLDIAGVQLEQDTVATPWERPNSILEDMLCKRYYQNGQWAMGGWTAAGVTVQQFHPWHTIMRAIPTVVANTTSNTNVNDTSISPLPNGFTASALGINAAGYLYSGTLTASAEIA